MWKYLWLVFCLSLTGSAWAAADGVMVDRVWVGESVPGQDSASLVLNITTVKPAKLISLSSPESERIEIHHVSKAKGKLKARVLGELKLPAHRTTVFGAQPLFLIMVGLKRELNVGDQVPVNVVVEYGSKRRETISVMATVKKMDLSYKHLGAGRVYDHR